MSTESGPRKVDLELIAGENETPKDAQIAKMEGDLQEEKDSRKEERFFWIFALLFCIDLSMFPAQSAVGVVTITILELVFLVVLAAWLGLEKVSVFISSVLNHFMKKNGQEE